MLPRSMMSSGSRGQQGQEDEGWANASPGQAEQGFAGRSEAAAPAGMPGVCAQGCMGAGRQVDPWAAYLQQQRFLQQQAYGQTLGHRVFDGNQIPVPQSPSQTTNGSSSQNLRNQGTNVPLMYQGFQGRPMGQMPQMPGVSQSAVNPNGNVLMQVADLLRRMSPVERQTVLQSLGDSGQPSRGHFVPERLGEAFDMNGEPFVSDETYERLPLPRGSEEKHEDKDVFSRSEKWLGSPPSVNHSVWKSREDEILGYNSYLIELIGWTSQASVTFAREIEQAARWPQPIVWGKLSKDQRTRSVRLGSLLKTAFASHSRISLLILGFQEGLDIQHGVTTGDVFANATTYMSNGYELLRQLTREFSLRSRTEALSLRVQLMSRTFQVSGSEAQISDLIRQIDFSVARFMKLASTLGGDVTGLKIDDSDMLSMLVRSLPTHVKDYVLLHATGDTYASYREAARRFEYQHRLFRDLQTKKPMFAVRDEEENGTVLSEGGAEQAMSTVDSNVKCTRCAKKGHTVQNCSTDLSKTKCYKCNQFGHVSVNCKGSSSKGGHVDDRKSKGSSTSFSSKGSPSTKGKGKGKGKGSKGSGKKGKMYAVCDEHGSWWYTEDFGEHVDGSDVPAADAEGANEESPPLILNGLLPTQLHVLLGGGELSFDHASPCDENMFDLSPIRVDMSVGDDMLFDFAFEGDTWLIEAEYDSDWLAVVQPMCGSCCASCDVVDGAWTEGFVRLDSTWCPPFVPGEEPATHTANGTVEEDVMSKSRLESELVVPHDVDFAIFNLSHGDDTCLTDGTSSDTCSVLLQSLNRGGDGYWLVDSGASVCVVTPNELKRFKHSPIRSLNRPMQAANGSDVLIDGFTRILLQVKVCNPKGEFVDGVIPLDVMVGQTSFCILSVCKLGELGWTTSIGKKGCSMIHESSRVKAVDVSVWHDTPWLFVSPYEGEDETFLKLLEVDVPLGIEKDLEGKVSVLTPQEMAAHRLRGHVPFEPSCETCQSCKGVHRHARKRTNRGLDVVIQADFAFFNRDSELVTDLEDDGSLLKFLVLKETFSSSHGAVLMSNDKQRDQQALIKWLDEFGLRTSDGVVSIELQTDAEDAVSSFVAGCSQYAFHVKKAAPQSHESAGHAERTVRAVKESFKTMLLDFQGMGYTLNFSREIVGRLLIYICMAHNNFRLVQGSSKTPREISVGKVVSKDQFALFGTKVLAELPDSILKQNKNLPRFSPAVFLHPDFASMGSVVMGKVRVGQELVIRTFIAKSLKLVLPIEIDNSFGLFVQLTDERSGLPVLEDAKEGGARILPEGQGLSCPASGPPLKWIEENGITQGCTACKSIEIHGTRKSRVHSRKCCERYEKWLSEQASVADLPREEIGDRPRDPSAEFEEFMEEFRPDPSVNRPTKPDDGGYSPSIGPASPDVVGDDDEKMSEGMVDKSAMSPDGERLDSPGDGKRVVEGDHVDLDLVRAFKRTHRCPACESGMSAPGIRHNAECKRARASVGEEYERVTKARRVTEATADELVQGLSPVLTGDPHDRLVRDLSGVISGVSEGNSLGGLDDVYQLAFLATKSDDEVRELPLMSVKFESEAGSEVVPFGLHSIRVWKPSSSVDDTTLKEMSGESTFLGMKKEVQNLSDLETGDLYTWAELEAAGLTASCRVIPCRWVTVDKRGVSGGVISVCGFLLKSLSRHQQMVSLSSMEAELFALQGVAQELASLGKLVGRVLKSLGRISVDELPSLLMTDSESSLKLLKNLDTPRKSRHLEIKLEWIKMQVNSEKLVVVFKRGTENPADLLTKCLATSLYVIHRSSLGFETCDGPIASITKSFGNYILIEVCCQPNSALSQEAKKKGMSYIGINDNMEQASVFKQVGNFVREFGHPKVFVHVSSPCASGSPLRYLSGSQPTDADFEWFAMFPWVSKYLALGHYSSFELPWRNSIWKHHLTIETLRKNKHDYHTMLHLCATGAKAKNGQSIGKVLGITSNSKQFVMSLSKAFGQCTCVDSHASMNEVDWSETAFYNNCMAKV